MISCPAAATILLLLLVAVAVCSLGALLASWSGEAKRLEAACQRCARRRLRGDCSQCARPGELRYQ